ncbi:unnamed protein product, partial [Chrysoparadoxa australica]
EGDTTVSCFGVFDGHGGATCSQWLTENLTHHFASATVWAQEGLTLKEMLRGAVEEGLAKAEESFLALAHETGEMSGACVVFGATVKGLLCVANIGDCQAALYRPKAESVSKGERAGDVVKLSVPHRSSDPGELARIQAAGGFVVNKRAFGMLEPSRSIGDLDVKRY